MMARKKKEPTPAFPEIEANRHHDTRKNIPTEELRDFVADDEAGKRESGKRDRSDIADLGDSSACPYCQ